MLSTMTILQRQSKAKYDDDIIDRLNYVYTTSILTFFMAIIGGNQYIGEVIQCWMPAEFMYTWDSYIENYCFANNTYYINDEKFLHAGENEKVEVKYYQWVHWLLFFQILLLVTPKILFNAFSWKTGLNVKSLIRNLSRKKSSTSISHAHKLLQTLTYNFRRRQTCYFTFIYLCFKMFNCLNAVFQLWFMNQILNTNYKYWGYEILLDLIKGKNWRTSGHFPRVAYCDFMRRDDTSSRPMIFTVQCVLRVNMFNEIVFIILWFWFVFLTVVNTLNFIFWFVTSLIKAWKTGFIREQLYSAGIVQIDKCQLLHFVNQWITTDGITALRLVCANCDNQTSSDFVDAIFYVYQKENKAKDL